MEDRAMLAWDQRYPPEQLNPRIAEWRAAHPDGTLEDLVRDLELWYRPRDEDAPGRGQRETPAPAGAGG
jgi:hypothetical protein